MDITFCPQAAEWGDIATWIAGLATLAAVVVALHAAKRERDKSIEIQERDWRRADDRLRIRTARLANAFSRDLVYAARELTLVLANLHPSRFITPQPAMVQYLVSGRPGMQLPMIDRFAGELDGFEDGDALALLTALASWRNFSEVTGIRIEDLDQQRAAGMAAQLHAAALVMHAEHRKLNDRMITYFEHLPELEGFVEDHLPEGLADAIRGGPLKPD